MKSIVTKLFVVLALLLAFVHIGEGSVLGVDLSAEFLKVAAVKSGNPFHIVVDEQAKRKVPVAVAFDDGERHFGNNAVGFAIRKPLDTFMWAHRLLGQTIDSPRVKELGSIFPYEYVTLPGRGKAVGIKTKEGVIYSPEELVAMSLEHVRKIAKDDGNGDVKEAVLSVPAWFTQKEREAVLNAAELGGLNVMSLVTDNAATAITYGIDRVYNPNVTHTAMILDMGSAGFEVSIVEYSTAKSRKYGKQVRHSGQVLLKASTFDDSLGGIAFDVIVRNILLDRFVSQHGDKVKGVRENPRALAKLLKQANAVKTILSANTQIPVRVDSVYNDLDLVTVITREEFYAQCTDLFQRIAAPIQDALAAASLTPDALEAVVVVGGTTRIPGVQARIREVLNREVLNQNVNADEAMAMGAVFRAANLSTIFQVREFGVGEINNFGVQLDIHGENLHKHIDVYPKFSPLGRKKVLSISHNGDISATLSHKVEELPPTASPFIRKYSITGVQGVIADEKYSKHVGSDGNVKIAIGVTLTESGISKIDNADVVFDITENVVLANGTVTDEQTTRKVRVPLTVTVVMNDLEDGYMGMTNELKEQYTHTLSELTRKDRERRELAAIRNALESKIYQIRNELSEDVFVSVTTEEERAELSKVSDAAEEWLYETDLETSKQAFETKLNELQDLFRDSEYRKNQINARKSAAQLVANAIEAAKSQVSNWSISKPWVKEQAKEVYDLAESIEKDVQEMLAKQDAADLTAAPLFDAKELTDKLKPLAVQIARVDKIKKPAPPKKPANKTKSNNTSKTEDKPAEEAEATKTDAADKDATKDASTSTGEKTGTEGNTKQEDTPKKDEL